MPPTWPPVSVAVPVIVTVAFGVRVAPAAGDVIVDTGLVVSVDAGVAVRPVITVVGCTPMSANRFIVACCMGTDAAALPRSWLASRPQAHCTVPAPKTRAPLGALYSDR